MADRRAAVDRYLTNPAYTLGLSQRCLRLAAGALALSGLLVAKLFVDELRPDRTKYFASNPHHVPYPMVPLDEPVITESAMLVWAVNCVAGLYNLDFVHYREDSQRSAECFEREPLNQWRSTFVEAGNLRRLVDSASVMRLSPTDAATVRKQQVVNGRMTWEVQFTAVLTIQNSNAPVREERTMKLTVRRSPDPAHWPQGVAIARIIDPPKIGNLDQRLVRK